MEKQRCSQVSIKVTEARARGGVLDWRWGRRKKSAGNDGRRGNEN